MGIRCDQTSPYHKLLVEQVRQEYEYLDVFKNKKEAELRLRYWLETFNLCAAQTSLVSTQKSCFRYGIQKCKGACCGEEKCESYNQRVAAIAESLRFPHENMLIIDKGKEVGEKSFVYVKEGVLQGFGYFTLHHQIKTISKIEARLIPITNNRDTRSVLLHFLTKKRYKKLINLAAQ